MARKVKAKIGDSLCNIAFLNGFGDCKPLREEPANAFIVNRVDNPGQVLPGDIVTVPDFIEHSESKGTEKKHKFVKRDNFAILRFVHGSKTSSVKNDRTLTFLNVSNFITNQAGVPDGNVAFPNENIRNFDANADKDIDAFKIEVLDIDATADLDVELEVLRPKYDAAGKVTGHERFPAAIRTPRLLTAKASKQGTTQRFRTCYLRLVTDDSDKAAADKQTLLTSDMHDDGDSKVEILDQTVKASYTIARCLQTPKCKSTVILPIGEDRRRLRLAIHVLNNKPAAEGGTPVVPLADAERRVFTWFRRIYAQANIAPKLMITTRAVDPPANLISISNDSGARAQGDGQIGFTIKCAGKADQIVPPVLPKRGDKPLKTAKALAAKVKAPYKAVVSENPARFVDLVNFRSADIIITEETGARVTLSIDIPLANRDTGQPIEIGVADPMSLLSWAVPDGNNNWNAGSIQQRAVLKNHDTGDDRVDIFVADKLSAGNRGEAMMANHRIDSARASKPKVKWSAFLSARTMNAGNGNPFSFPHEVVHVTAEVVHATAGTSGLMFATATSGTSGANSVAATKRIRDDAVNYDAPRGNFNIVRRLRVEGAPLLEKW